MLQKHNRLFSPWQFLLHRTLLQLRGLGDNNTCLSQGLNNPRSLTQCTKAKPCPFVRRASYLTEEEEVEPVEAEANTVNIPEVEGISNEAPRPKEAPTEVAVKNPTANEQFLVGGRLFHFRDKWKFSPWAHSVVSRGLGWSWETGQRPCF